MKILKKLRKASLNSKFTSSNKKVYMDFTLYSFQARKSDHYGGLDCIQPIRAVSKAFKSSDWLEKSRFSIKEIYF